MQIQSLNTKIALWAGVCILVTASIIVAYSGLTLKKATIETAKQHMVSLAKEASGLEAELTTALDAARTIAQLLGKAKDIDNPLDLQRYEAFDLLRSVLIQNPEFTGVFTLWEPNAFDFMDEGYKNEKGHDDTGRFAPFWRRITQDEISLMPLSSCRHHFPQGILSSWYDEVKSTKHEYLTSPYLHHYTDRQVNIITAVAPIIVSDTFYGVVGIDQEISFLHGEDIQDIFPNQSGVMTWLQSGEEVLHFINGHLFSFIPVKIGRTQSTWGITIIVPAAKITESASKLMWKQIALFAAIMLAMIILASLGSRTITKPLALLIDGIERVIAGDFTHNVDVKSRDEIGKVASIFNKMTSKLNETLHELEQHQEHLEDMVAHRTEELEKAVKKLKESQATILQQEKMASIGQLAAGVAHEINNPMGFISSNIRTLEKYISRLEEFMEGQAKILKSNALPEAQDELKKLSRKLKIEYILEDTQDLIKESLEGADRVKQIVQDLKSFSRLDQAQQKMVNINNCLDETLNIAWNELKYKATVNKDYGALALTMCFPQQLNQVFWNLLVNASQAIEDQGEINIKTWMEKDSVYAAISDTGCGIPEDKVDKLFEPFFTTKEAGQGTGLGLSICYDIIKKHNGDITVASEAGKSTTFTIRIPITETERIIEEKKEA